MGIQVSANYLERLTGKKRQTISKKCEGLDTEKGTKNAILYDSAEALERIYLGDGGDYQSAQREKARLDHHRANMEELREKKLRGEIVPFDQVVRAVSEMIAAAKAKFMAMPARVAQMLPVEPEVRRQAQELIRQEVFSGLDELSERNLEGMGGVDEDVESAPDSDGQPVGRGSEAVKPGGKRRAGKVEEQQVAPSG